MKNNCTLRLVAIIVMMISFSACDPNASKKTLGNTQDTTSVTKGGGPPIRDTATINKDRRDSARRPAKANTAKGNADPSGRIKNQ
jgi:hypothetical protein